MLIMMLRSQRVKHNEACATVPVAQGTCKKILSSAALAVPRRGMLGRLLAVDYSLQRQNMVHSSQMTKLCHCQNTANPEKARLLSPASLYACPVSARKCGYRKCGLEMEKADSGKTTGHWQFRCLHWSYYPLAAILVAESFTFFMVLLPHFLRDEYSVSYMASVYRLTFRCICSIVAYGSKSFCAPFI